jgi:APA family basic amino acid/polyamine antiporter
MLNRSITLLHATALVVGTIIGVSIFVQPSIITGAVPSLRMVYVVWIAAGLLTLCGALIAAELASAFPQSGGLYVFLREGFSPGIAFLWGWAMFWTMHTGIIAAIATVMARYAAFFAHTGDAGTRLIAIGAIVVLTAVNYVGVRFGRTVQTTLTIAKVVAVLSMVVLAFALPSHIPTGAVAVSQGEPLSARGFALALIAGLFAFGGWHMVTYMAEETRDPERTIPRALFVGVLAVTACYVALNAAYFHVLTPAMIASSTRVAADAADAVLGRGGAALMSGVVTMSAFGALNGIILAGPRVYLSMARDGLLFKWAGEIHPRYRTPHRALMLQAAWAIVLVSTGTYRELVTRVVYTEWGFFALMAVGLMRLRRRPGYSPPYRVGGYPVVPVVFAAASVCILANQFASEPAKSLTGLALVGVGYPVYLLWLRRPSRTNVSHAD